MEMEKVNDNTIRVILTNDDLDKRGVTVLALMGNHAEIEKFFYSILDEVDTDNQFSDTDAVTFQMIPGKAGGIELLISKATPDAAAAADNAADDDYDKSDDADKLLNMLNSNTSDAYADENNDGVAGLAQLINSEMNNDKESQPKVTPTPVTSLSHKVVYSFASLNDLVRAASLIDEDHRAALNASLYLLDDRYYLSLGIKPHHFAASQFKPLNYVVGVLAEYGRNEAKMTPWALAERGQLIVQDHALATLKKFM